MAGPDEPLQAAFRPPTTLADPTAEPDASVSSDALPIRLHLVVLLVALVLHGIMTSGLLVELLDPQPTLSPEISMGLLGAHAVAPYMLVLPVLLGVLPMLTLPRLVGGRSPYPPWLAYLGLAVWCSGLVMHAIGPVNAVLGRPLGWWGLHALLLADCIYAAGVALAVVRGGRALLRRSPILCLSLLASAAGTLLTVVLMVLVLELGPPESGFYVPETLSIILPPVLCLTTLFVERRHEVSVASGLFPWALIGSCIVAWLPTSTWTILLAPLALVVVMRLAPLLVARATDPVSLSLLGVLVAAEIAVFGHAVIAVSDPFMIETYLGSAPKHLASGAVLLLLVAACLDAAPLLLGRAPRRGLAIAGVLGLGGGLLTFAAAMLVLGQHGRLLFSPSEYEPRFQALHQQMGLGGLVMAVGLGLVVLAVVTGRRAAPGHPPVGAPVTAPPAPPATP